MLKYTIKRLIMVPILLLLVAFFIFLLLNLSTADPVLNMLPSEYTKEQYDALAHKFGLDQPILVQYVNWVGKALQGDMGISYKTREPVVKGINFRIPISLNLALITTLIMVVIGIPLGVLCAVKQYSAIDSIINVTCMFLGSIPGFWLGLMLIMVFSVGLGWFPVYGMEKSGWYVLPIFTLLLPFLANFVRQVRSAMLDCIRQDYIRTARSKGAKESHVIFKEALKNALLPIITLTGGIFATMIGGAVLVEKVFAIPGIGLKLIESINNKDIPTLLACTMILSLFTIIVQLLIDISYAFIDPRIKSTFISSKKRKHIKKLKEVC